MRATTLVGRDAVLELAYEMVGNTGRVLIEGPAGIGKTSLLQALVDRATEQGMVVVRCAPAETEAALPLAALADLLDPLVKDFDALPAPQRHAARSALLLDTDEGPIDERALASAVRTVLDAAADRSPAGVLVAIDDVPWLDPPSERALQFALRRSSDRVRVVITRRVFDDVDAKVPLGLDAQTVEHVNLTPLGVGPLHRLLAQRFGVSLSRPVVARLTRESGGNPLLAIEMTRAALRLPRMPGPGSDFPVPASMHELVDASLATLAPDSVQAARLAALLSTPHVSDLSAAGVAPDALDAVQDVGLLTVDDGRIRFVHPVYASAVRAGIPAAARRRLHALLAEVSSDSDERARQLAQSTTDADDAIAAELADAAERARARGAPDLAADFYERAGDLTADTTAATERKIRALHCLFDCGSYQSGRRAGRHPRADARRRSTRRCAAAARGHRLQRRRPAARDDHRAAGAGGRNAVVPPGRSDPRPPRGVHRPRAARPRARRCRARPARHDCGFRRARPAGRPASSAATTGRCSRPS